MNPAQIYQTTLELVAKDAGILRDLTALAKQLEAATKGLDPANPFAEKMTRATRLLSVNLSAMHKG